MASRRRPTARFGSDDLENKLFVSGGCVTKEEREDLGRLVCEAWREWAIKQPSPDAMWHIKYDQLTEPQKELRRQIGERLYRHGQQYPELRFDSRPPLGNLTMLCGHCGVLSDAPEHMPWCRR